MKNQTLIETVMSKIPIPETAASAGLFLVAIFISRVFGKWLERRLARSQSEGFIGEFLTKEKKLLIHSIRIIVWFAFIVFLSMIWADYIEKIFSSAKSLYAPIIKGVVIVVIALMLYRAIHLATEILLSRLTPVAEKATLRGKQRMNSISQIFRYGSSAFIFFVASLMLLETFGIDLKAILATIGVGSLAVGFGAQSLVKDVIGGVFILCEDQFGVGDIVDINGEGGLVERMTLRITQLRNSEGTLITVPNGSIVNVKNFTNEWSRVDYKICVALKTDLEFAIKVLSDEAEKLKNDMPEDITDNPEVLGVDEFQDSAVVLRLWFKTAPLRQWVVRREFNKRVHKRFKEEGISIPFPQRTLWVKPEGITLPPGAEK
ncbi:MAG TPA: mechanosensitive ion channel family protein [bacterium]|nr:mechanosensitive ion channel family protein [bacterium]